MQILLIYSTYSGGTELVSTIIADVLAKKGITITRKHLKETKPDELDSFEVIIFGTPSWMVHNQDGQPHEFYFPFMEALKDKDFSQKKFAVFGLGDSVYTRFCHGVDVLEDFIKQHKGQLLLDSLRIDGFFFQQTKNEERAITWANELVSKIGS